MGAVMLLACIGGPALAGGLGGLGAGVVLGGGAVFAVAVCAAVPAVAVLRRRTARRPPAADV